MQPGTGSYGLTAIDSGEATARLLDGWSWCCHRARPRTLQSMVICTPSPPPPSIFSAWPSSHLLFPRSHFNHRCWDVVCCHLRWIYSTINTITGICILPNMDISNWDCPSAADGVLVCLGRYTPTVTTPHHPCSWSRRLCPDKSDEVNSWPPNWLVLTKLICFVLMVVQTATLCPTSPQMDLRTKPCLFMK